MFYKNILYALLLFHLRIFCVIYIIETGIIVKDGM